MELSCVQYVCMSSWFKVFLLHIMCQLLEECCATPAPDSLLSSPASSMLLALSGHVCHRGLCRDSSDAILQYLNTQAL